MMKVNFRSNLIGATKIIFWSLFCLSLTAPFLRAEAGTLLHFNLGTIDTSKKIDLTSLNRKSLLSKDKKAQSHFRFHSRILSGPAVASPQLDLQDLTVNSNSESNPTEYLLQFSHPISDSDQSQLKKQFLVFGYFPDDALVVRGSYAELMKYAKVHSGIQAVVRYAPILKLSSDLTAPRVFNQSQWVEVTVTLFANSEEIKISHLIQNMNDQIVIQEIAGRYLHLWVPREMILQIAALAGVEHIEPRPVFEIYNYTDTSDASEGSPKSSDYSKMTGFEDGTKLMLFGSAWAQGFTGRNQLLAIADTGVDSGKRRHITKDLQCAIREGIAFGEGSASWADPMGHGTHAAGLMVGRGVSSGRWVRGGAYEAQLLVESLWSPKLKTLTFPANLGDLFEGAYKKGARIHSNSWGSNRDLGSYSESAAQVDEWTFNHPDMLVVFAAGNNGIDSNKDGRVDGASLGVPGTAKNSLTVGASKNLIFEGGDQGLLGKTRGGASKWPSEPLFSSAMSENEKGLAAFSSRGPTKDGRLKPDLVAPGTNILGVKSLQEGASSLWGYFNTEYTWSGGTSMAAPLVAGAAGVARQILIKKWGLSSPSAAVMKAALIHTAEDLFPGQFGALGENQGQELLSRRPNMDEGYGRVNMDRLMNLGVGTQVYDNPIGVKQDEFITYKIEIKKEASLWVNLVWTDAPGSANAEISLVNDLDLELIGPDGQVHRTEDHLNNSESLEISKLQPGNYLLNVKGFRVPQGHFGAQPFALIFSIYE
jgi:subtilisin family serine protease